jgi:hypothetical protein
MAPAALTTAKAVERRATAKYAHPNHLRHHGLVVLTPNTTHTRLPSDTLRLSGVRIGRAAGDVVPVSGVKKGATTGHPRGVRRAGKIR